jgi:PHD/YefM family antitoxin component YafN of YafNO toxin-antitoxin module
MFTSRDICSISEFVRNHRRHFQELKKSGRPEVLTINGAPELVVQAVHAYEQTVNEADRLRSENESLREKLEALESMRGLDQAYAELLRGEGVPLEEALPALRARLNIGVPAR